MDLYADSSALLAWLLIGHGVEPLRKVLEACDHVITSELAALECECALIRGVELRKCSQSDADQRRRRLSIAWTGWQTMRLTAAVWERAKLPFPHEPVRTLDALHLSCLLRAAREVPGLALLSLDKRMRASARGLGIEVQPPGPD